MNRCALALTLALTTGHALAADLVVSEPWVRGTVPAQKVTGAFMQLQSKTPLAIVGASSPAAGVVEIHEMAMEGNTMHMRALPRLEVPAGKVVELKPGSYHIMLMDLKQPLAAGQTVPITLQVESGGKKESVEVQAPVRSLTGMPGGMPDHSMHK